MNPTTDALIRELEGKIAGLRQRLATLAPTTLTQAVEGRILSKLAKAAGQVALAANVADEAEKKAAATQKARMLRQG